MELKGLKAHFLGDSITHGVGTSDPSRIYLNLLKERVGLAEANNYGISGTRIALQTGTTDYAPACDAFFGSRVDGMAPDADLIVVFGGTNDYGHGDALIGQMSDRDPHTFFGGCHYLCRKLITRYPHAQIVFITPLHCQGDEDVHEKKSPDGSQTDRPVLETYVRIIREVCAYYAIPVCDFFATSGIQPNLEPLRTLYCPDGLHPNDAGHERMEKRLEGFLKAL